MTIITRFRGDTSPIVIEITDARTHVPLDLTGISAKLSVSTVANPTDAPDVFTLNGIATGPGVMSFPLTDQQANALVVSTLFYDLQLTDFNGKRLTVDKDEFRVVQDITK